ncbi:MULTISPECIES: amylo-alpha-1,6-glucosidase [Cytobacillus]|uniref:amylo-alpha-1,6-glucosidase n=1 Tax=Cytobacillus TaxID=2675230 RepID=UPI0020406964|nr:glycogen debranching N-terminal domain-containing protein [Cytobacillus firmus]MCM3705995.1 amylo-alpha-1,6-glucosidase [Cytobacillus firmus]
MSYISLKHGETFSVTNHYGDIEETLNGTGIYYKDTRYLKRYVMKVNNQPCIFLTKKQTKGIENSFKLSNSDIQNGDSRYEKMDLEINRSQLIYNETFYDKVEVANGSQKDINCCLSFSVEAAFEDIFEVRGAKREKRGKMKECSITENTLLFSYRGLDGLERKLHITGTNGVQITENEIKFNVSLAPGEKDIVELRIEVLLDAQPANEALSYQDARYKLEQKLYAWFARQTKITTSNPTINRTLKQAELDLYMLSTDTGHGHFPIAGIPWYSVPFGRDSILAAIQTLVLDPSLAKNTLRTLAAVQGETINSSNEEAPGKILHEMRNGEMANLGEVPYKRYYGSIDATPLFIVLFTETIRWTGDQNLLNELLPSVERALAYLEEYADLDGDTFIEYHNQVSGGLAVQSWKDSTHSMVHKDGTHSESPMAVVEVQGYLYDAKQKMAELYDYMGNMEQADQLRKEAVELQEKFNAKFWMENEKYYALALDKEKKQVQTITSDPGHALWSGIVPPEKGIEIANTLLGEGLFSGWGIRTMSKDEKVYSPVAYHNGTVWPHDNSIIALGLAKYGFKEQVNQLASALFASAEQFEDNRLPELFCGYGVDQEETIVPYPVACSPQAWAAGTPFALAQALLGLQVDSLNKVIRLNPILPENIDWMEFTGIHAGNGQFDLIIKRENEGITLEITKNTSGSEISQVTNH